MKKTILIATCTLSLLAAYKSNAQVSVNVQFGTPVMNTSWCGADDDYYYIPQHGVYYNVHRRMYVYPHGGSWCYAPTLPAFYGAYNFAPGSYHHVHARAPFRNHGYYQRTYAYRPMHHGHHGHHKGGGYHGGHHNNGNHYGHYKKHDKHHDRHEGRDDRYADDRHYANDNGRNNDDDRGGRGGYRR